MRMSELLNEVNAFELDEGFSPKEIKMAIGIASDPRYAKGNMTGAVNSIEKMKRGLSKHPQVAAVLKRQNEGFASDAQRKAAFASGYKEKDKKDKKEGNAFGMALKAARDNDEKTFVVSGKKYNVEDYDIKEDGHTDVASAVRQCKTMVEDATQIMSKLQTMSPEESLPSWWTNKLAIASNSMNKLRDYFLVPTNVTEELQEAMGDLEDLKKMVAELEKASQMHLGQSKRVQAHVDMMSKMEETELGEEISINELKMNDPKLLKVFDKLKPKDTVKIKSSSTISQGKDFIEYQVKTKNTLRNGVEKITMMLKGNPTGKNRFLYKKNDKVTFAIGDLGASIDDIKESEEVELGEAFKPDQVKAAISIARDNRFSMKGMVDKKTAIEKIAKGLSKDPAVKKVLDKMYEEFQLKEKYDLYHKDFSSAMQHAYSYAKQKLGITIDPKEIDSKVATGPKKPTEGKTNKYRLKGKGGNVQIQVYNKGGSKPFELNMYKEENELISQASKHISHMQMAEKIDPADVDDDASEKDIENAAKNIIMQLRKSVSMRGNKDVEFASGKQKVDMRIAQKAISMHMKMKPQDKLSFQNTIAKSYKDLLNAVKGK